MIWALIIVAGIVLLAYAGYVWRKTSGHPLYALRAWLGWGKSVDDLGELLKIATHKLKDFQPRYTARTIPKRSGGMPELWVPDEKTKALQRRLLRRVFARLRAHDAARGFERGRSIVHNALPHVGQAVVIRMDVVDFFPSTHANRIEKYFRRVGWNREAATLLTRLTTHEQGLPQGAPTSPRLSNVVNFDLDQRLSAVAKSWGGAYTRYADDITFSLAKEQRGSAILVRITKAMLARKGYRMHWRKKLSVRRRHQRQVVTGLVVNDKLQLPRAKRRWLRAVRHHLATGRPATIEPHQLQGWDAFETMIRKQR